MRVSPSAWRLLVSALLLGGCTMVSSVGLRHPQTGQTVRREGYQYWNVSTRQAQEDERQQQRCIEDYERQGFVLVP